MDIRASIEINAPPSAVWRVLTDFASYPLWNPLLRSVEGEASVGAQLRVEVAPPGGRSMTFTPKVTAVEIDRRLRWLGRPLVPGLFDGDHEFVLEQLSPEVTRVVQREHFSGVLVPLFGG